MTDRSIKQIVKLKVGPQIDDYQSMCTSLKYTFQQTQLVDWSLVNPIRGLNIYSAYKTITTWVCLHYPAQRPLVSRHLALVMRL